MTPEWMKELGNPESNREFSQLVNDYYKLATMRVMQFMREKYNVPKEDIPTLTLAIMARFLNDSVYAIGANLKSDYPITNFYSKEQLLTLVKVLNGESLSPFDRKDIDTDIQRGLSKFKEFIMKNASDFYKD